MTDPETRTCPHCSRPIRRLLVRGRRVGDWTCHHCCCAWEHLPVVEHATAVVVEDLPDGGARLSRVDGTVIGPRSIVRPEARRPEETP